MSGGVDPADDGRPRCGWATGPWLVPYHDAEWGVPVHDDRTHFEFIVLEGAQAGLSWLTILKRRDGYRAAFSDFDPEKVARYSEKKIESLLADEGIIRNRLKVTSAVKNAQRFLAVAEEHGTFDAYVWSFVDGRPVVNRWKSDRHLPAVTPLAETMSKDMRRRGFSFVGPTIVYAHLQATGVVMDHVTNCFRWPELSGA